MTDLEIIEQFMIEEFWDFNLTDGSYQCYYTDADEVRRMLIHFVMKLRSNE